MKMRWYVLTLGKLQEQQAPFAWRERDLGQSGEIWIDVEDAKPEELRQLLTPLDLHPLQLARCLDAVINPGVLAFGDSVLMEYPAAFDPESADPAYLTVLLHTSVLITIRHGPMPALDDFRQSLLAEGAPLLRHLPELIYEILDRFSDLNVEAQIGIRDRILHAAKLMAEDPNAVNINDLARLRWQVGNLISLIENQLYCVTGLNASDNTALQEPHRKAYIEDLVTESEIAQRGVYRLETRVNDLYRDYQMVGADRVEKRLRLLTIVSAITLPLGLIAGLLGMNVGGVPGINMAYGFAIVVTLMAMIALAQYWYFRRHGWFD